MGSMRFGILLGWLPHSKWEHVLRPCSHEDISFAPFGCSGRHGFIRCPHECPAQALNCAHTFKKSRVWRSLGCWFPAHSANIPLEKSSPTAGCPPFPAVTPGVPTIGMAALTQAGAMKGGVFKKLRYFLLLPPCRSPRSRRVL